MPLPWTEIRDKDVAFSREWQDAESERAEAKSFWNEKSKKNSTKSKKSKKSAC